MSDILVCPLIIDERPEGYLTAAEYSRKFNVTQSAVCHWVRRGKLRSFKIGMNRWILDTTPRPTNPPYIRPRNGKPKSNQTNVKRPEGYLTTSEYADKLGVTYGCVRQWIKRGKLEYLELDGHRWIFGETPFPKEKRKGRRIVKKDI